jgi:hypothetical protein
MNYAMCVHFPNRIQKILLKLYLLNFHFDVCLVLNKVYTITVSTVICLSA